MKHFCIYTGKFYCIFVCLKFFDCSMNYSWPDSDKPSYSNRIYLHLACGIDFNSKLWKKEGPVTSFSNKNVQFQACEKKEMSFFFSSTY